ncbi:MAG: hypothetical protein U9R00_00700, partial [Patescibacteria group bacterium]|nr:hypothetical protein [Patescibacteria group bacterium]
MLKIFKSKTAKTVGGLMVGFLLLSGSASAASLTQAQVDAILSLLNSFGADTATVANVQASLTGGTPTGGTTTGTYDLGSTTLRVGSKGTYVQNLQAFLGATADGIFGPMTKAKVVAWQS